MIATLLSLALLQAPPTLEIRVEGEGFLRFNREGRMVYARQASLTLRRGELVHIKGPSLMPSIEGFREGEEIRVSPNGEVKAVGAAGATRTLGRLALALFPEDIRPVESRGFLIAADRPAAVYPGAGKAGTIVPASSQPQPKPHPVPQAAAVKLALTLKAEAEVMGDKITIADLAEITGPEDLAAKAGALDLGATPALGVPRPIDRAAIEARLARAGFLLASITVDGQKVTVSRKGRKVAHEEFVQAAREAVQKAVDSSLSLEAVEPGPVMTAPLGELVLKAENVTLVRDLASATVVVFVEGKRFNSRLIKLRVATPLAGLKMGQSVTLRVKSGGASVQTTGKVRTVDIAKNEVTVESATGALLTGKMASDGAIEVTL